MSWLGRLPDLPWRGSVRECSTVVEVKISCGTEIKAKVVKRREARLAAGESGQVSFEASADTFARMENKERSGTSFVQTFPPSPPSLLRSFWTSGLAETLMCATSAVAFDVHLKQRRRGDQETDPGTQRDQRRLRHPFSSGGEDGDRWLPWLRR